MFYGETESPDCPADRSFCFISDKAAMFTFGGAIGDKPGHITAPSPKPYYKFKTDSLWGTKVFLYRNTFLGFQPKTKMEKRQSVFAINEYGSDYIPIHQFFDTKFINV